MSEVKSIDSLMRYLRDVQNIDIKSKKDSISII